MAFLNCKLLPNWFIYVELNGSFSSGIVYSKETAASAAWTKPIRNGSYGQNSRQNSNCFLLLLKSQLDRCHSEFRCLYHLFSSELYSHGVLNMLPFPITRWCWYSCWRVMYMDALNLFWNKNVLSWNLELTMWMVAWILILCCLREGRTNLEMRCAGFGMRCGFFAGFVMTYEVCGKQSNEAFWCFWHG